jgi:pyruvate, water dikinase
MHLGSRHHAIKGERDSMTDNRPKTKRGAAGFPSPFEPAIPSGCDGWEEMYPYHALFSGDRGGFEEGRFWFQDSLHYPEPFRPFDAVTLDYTLVAFSQASARLFVVPPSLGGEYRVLNGYVYISANSVTDRAALSRRADLFAGRGGYYYEHWDELYARWLEKVEGATTELARLEVPDLAEFEDEAVVTEARGWGSSHALLVAYDRLLEGIDRILQFHFEFLNLGYGAYLTLYELCRGAFPDIDDQTIARMVSGIDLVLLRPDEELRRLARRAFELGVADPVTAARNEEDLHEALGGTKAGERWLADLQQTKDPWFYLSYGSGCYSHHRSWIDDTTLPIAMIGSYLKRLEAGEDISRPSQTVIAERDRITAEFRSLLGAEARPAFDESLALARTVFPYVENHNFYIDHRYFGIFWNKVREFGKLLARHRFLAAAEDIFFLRQDEVRSALEELRVSWSAGGIAPALGPARWPPIVARRKSMIEEMRRWTPPRALGRLPDEISEPMTVMLWGITTERAREWVGSGNGAAESKLEGVAGSPGTAEGPARVILDPRELDRLEHGEVLVASSTSTSWTPAFVRASAAVSDIGGIMSHAAIVAREYGLPAVLGTGTATKTIKTGDRVRVDGDAGLVTILD